MRSFKNDMKVVPINLFSKPKGVIENNQYDYSQNKLLILRKTPVKDTVSFSSSIMSGKDFKKLSKHMTCLYTGEKMLSSEQLNRMKNKGFFKGPISEVVRKLKPYKDKYLEPIELSVFELIEEAAKETPDIGLPQLFKNLYLITRVKFRKTQKPYFDELKTLGAQLPQEYLEKFYNYMVLTDKKLYDMPIKIKFSTKEFRYKAVKIINKCPDLNLRNRVTKLLDLLDDQAFLDDTKSLSPQIVKKVFDFKNLKTNGKKSNYYTKYLQVYEREKDLVRQKILEKIKDVANISGNKKLEKLCEVNIDIIKGSAVRVPFSNKVFIYDLQKILADLPDEQLKQRILGIAFNLPTSSKSADALILKFQDADANIIGDRLFNQSLATIEHLKPASLGGSDKMVNCALAKKWINSKRMSKPLWEVLQIFPLKNQQLYAKNLVKLNHKQFIKYEDALAHLETIEAEGRIDLSPYKEQLIRFENPLINQLIKKFNKEK